MQRQSKKRTDTNSWAETKRCFRQTINVCYIAFTFSVVLLPLYLPEWLRQMRRIAPKTIFTNETKQQKIPFGSTATTCYCLLFFPFCHFCNDISHIELMLIRMEINRQWEWRILALRKLRWPWCRPNKVCIVQSVVCVSWDMRITSRSVDSGACKRCIKKRKQCR